jgi:hypothetical protein
MRATRVLALALVVAAVAVPAASALDFTEGIEPPDGTVGVPYSFQFQAVSGCKPYAFSIKAGALPAGLTMTAAGLVSGTPTAAGSVSFWAELKDTCGFAAQELFTINIARRLTVATAPPLAPALVGVPYSVQFTSEGGGTVIWSLAHGSLPPGFSFSDSGLLSGTASAVLPAPVSLDIKVTDVGNGTRNDIKTFVFDVVTPLAVTAPALPTGEVGLRFKPATVVAAGGRGPYTWSLVGAPAGLTIDPASGAIGGTPAAAGAFTFQVSAKDVYGATASANAAVTVKGKLTLKAARLPVTTQGKDLRVTLRSTGGVGPLTWKVTSGKLPVGIRFDSRTGVLSGTAKTAGVFRLTFAVTDSLGGTSKASYTLTVIAAKKKT